MDIKFCPQCRCTTWHVDGVCEWVDAHKEAEEIRKTLSRPECVDARSGCRNAESGAVVLKKSYPVGGTTAYSFGEG